MQGRGTIKERKTEQNIGSGMKIKKAYMKEGKKLNEGKIMEATRNERERMCLYLLERRSMLLSGSEKLESTVQKDSDMLTLVQCNHCSDTATLGRGCGQQTDAGFHLPHRQHQMRVRAVSVSPPAFPLLILPILILSRCTVLPPPFGLLTPVFLSGAQLTSVSAETHLSSGHRCSQTDI